MRFAVRVALPLLLFTACGSRRDPIKPNKPAIQIIIPDTPGWSPSTNSLQKYSPFEAELRERIRISDGVIQNMTWQQRDLTTVLTLYGEHPSQILTIALPFIKHAGLPAGSTITAYDGSDGRQEQPVPMDNL
jgi:outer membrane biogenesis lipoprotein LolB